MNEKELKFVLQEGEGLKIEFKEAFDKNLSREIVAFANANGGSVFLGVSDSGEIKGVDVTNNLKSKLQDMASNCDPKIDITLEQFGNVLIIEVPEGKNKPYSCSYGFYLRVGPNSQKMKRNEILNLAKEERRINFDEQICRGFDWKDFDEDKFEAYLKLAKISRILSRNDILKNLNVLTPDGITNAGVLFFAKSPSKYIKSSVVRCLHFSGSGRVNILDKKEIDKGIIDNIRFAFDYLKERVPVRFEIKTLARKEFPEYPEDAYRELIVNSIIHRDYSIVGPDVAVEKLKDRIFINNPGGLLKSFPKGMFGKISWPRNRLLCDLLSRTYLMEKVGTGVKRVENFCKSNKNRLKVVNEGNYYSVEIFSNVPENAPENAPENVPEKRQIKIINNIRANPRITIKKLAVILRVDEKTIKRDIETLKITNKLVRVGPDKGGYWKIKDE